MLGKARGAHTCLHSSRLQIGATDAAIDEVKVLGGALIRLLTFSHTSVQGPRPWCHHRQLRNGNDVSVT